MDTPQLVALATFMLALVHALVIENWRSNIRSALRPKCAAPVEEGASPSLSVIIPARDAGDTIAHLLQDLYEQDLPRDRYEVIVVDDHSTDGTRATVERMQRNWPALRLIKAGEEQGKKAAIMRGASEAFHDPIVLTDADVRCGPSRLSGIARHWAAMTPDLVLMPVETIRGRGMHQHLQRMEQVALQAVAAGSGTMGGPMLANGANMAFSRAAFFMVDGFRGDRLASGDDMFLLQRMRSARKKITYLLEPGVVVSVDTERTLGDALQQRLRWAGKMRAYREFGSMSGIVISLLLPWFLAWATILVLDAVEYGQRMMSSTLMILSAWLFWGLPILRLVHTMDAFFTHAMELNKPSLGPRRQPLNALSTIPALIAFMIYAPIIAIVSIFVRPRWKGRRI